MSFIYIYIYIYILTKFIPYCNLINGIVICVMHLRSSFHLLNKFSAFFNFYNFLLIQHVLINIVLLTSALYGQWTKWTHKWTHIGSGPNEHTVCVLAFSSVNHWTLICVLCKCGTTLWNVTQILACSLTR